MNTQTHYPMPNIAVPEDWERIEEFMRTHVGRYVLPKKLAGAEKAGRASVTVPASDMTRLLARVGAPPALAIVPEPAPAAPEPINLERVPAELVSLFDWEPDGVAILERGQVEALIARGIRMALDSAAAKPAPRKRTTAPKVPATVPQMVADAVAAGKATVSVPTAELARMLAQVDAERAALRLERVA